MKEVTVLNEADPGIQSDPPMPSAQDGASGEVGPAPGLISVLTVLGFALPVAAYLWLIHQYAVNIVWLDQWFDLGVISHAYSHTLSLSTLWAQHTENRIFFPNLIVILLAHATHFNVVVEEYVSAGMLLVATGLFIAAHRRRSPTRPWIFYCPVVIVMFSFVQDRDTLWGFQLAWYLVLMMFAIALFLLDRPALHTSVVVGAMAAAVVGSFSSLEGLLIWPAGLVLLYLRGRPRSLVLAWIATAVVTGVVFFYHFSLATSTANQSALHNPIQALKAFLFNVGDVLGVYHSGVGFYAVYLLGLLLFVVAIYVVIAYGLRRNEADGSPLGVALVWFGLLFAVLVAVGRSSYGLAVGSRYAVFDHLILVGCYLAIFDRPTLRIQLRRSARTPRTLYRDGPIERLFGLPTEHSQGRTFDENSLFFSRAILIFAVFLLLVVGTGNGLAQARDWHQKELLAADVAVNIQSAPDSLVKSALFFSAPGAVSPRVNSRAPAVILIRQMASFAKAHHLSLFATGAVALYKKEGLPRATAVVAPRHGATLKGLQWLVATTSDNSVVIRVEFRLTGGRLKNTVIAIGNSTVYGWFTEWSSSTVPNGTYTLQSVVHDAAGHVTYSPGVVVKIKN